MNKKLSNFLVAGIGYLLSPLSWWNDLFINVPLAYVFSYPFSLISEHMFLPAFIFGYWLTNLLGFLLLHWGGMGLLNLRQKSISLNYSLLISAIYSIVIIIFVLLGWLESPDYYLHRIKS